MNIKLTITTIALAASTGLQAQSVSAPLKVNGSGNEASNYFTAVFLSDPHVEQTGYDGASVGTYKDYCQAIINLGKDGGTGKQYQFNALPGYTPKADIVFCLGDMDQDSEKSGDNFKAAFHKLNAAGIPFVTMLGNHDAVPDYWTGDNPDKGLTLGTIFEKGGSECNDVAMNLVRAQVDTAKTHGISDVEWITDGSKHTQLSPFTFTFQGVRFYCGQAYWFQKPYDKPKTALGTATYYAPDGVISALETFVDKHTDEPSVWMQHYPFTYGSDCDRWWLDQNDTGKYIATKDESAYGTHISSLGKYDTDATAQGYAKKKKDKLAELIKKTKNGVHFSGHVHSYGDYTYGGVRDYTVAAPGITSGGMFLVLMSKTDGVVEVKKIDLADVAYNQADSTGVIDNTGKVTLTAGADASALLGTNLDFETTQADANADAKNMHAQPGWSHVWSVDAISKNVQYTQAYQVTDQQSGAPTSHALRLRTRWQKQAVNNYIFKEAKLPAGNYTLTYYINKAATAGISEDLCYYEIDGKRAPLPASSGSWSKQTVPLNVPSETTLRLNFGYRGGAGSNEALIYVDDVQLTYNSAYQADDKPYTRYLFTFFPSNSDENIYYAVSTKDEPFSFTVLNDGQRMLAADSVSVKQGLRDPHLLRGHDDGYYYMVATDMRSAEGWSSNRGIVMMRSKDLVNWEHHTVNFPTRYAGTDFAKVTRVWAPEVIWDDVAQKYMVYFSLLGAGADNTYDKVYRCYANSDFSDLEGTPVWMYDRGSATIDMDIIRKGDTYHGFYKNENAGGIGHVTASSLTGEWTLVSNAVQQTSEAVEGVGVYKLINEDRYVVMYDCYNNGHYQFCTTSDFNTFTVAANTETKGAFTPRHGSVLPITDEEYATIDAWINDKLGRNTREVSGANLWNPVKTTFVTNGSFDNGTTGWSYTTKAQNHGTTTNKDNKVVHLAFENWDPSLQAGKMYQTVSDIPSGTYTLDITAWADNMEGKQVYMDGNTLPLTGTANEANNYRIIAYLDGNQTEVGLEATKAAGTWMGIDNVQLTYWGKDNIVDEVKAKLLADADISADNQPLDSYARYTEAVTLGDWTTTNHTTNKSQHWDGTDTSTYHEQKDGWGASAWSMGMKQDITLPAGRYVLKVACRAASARVDARITVDDKSVLAPTNDDYGLGIDTQGHTDWDASGSYANGNKGRGWEWRYLPFTVTETSTHTIALSAKVTDGLHHWVSFSDVQLLRVPSVTIDEKTTFEPTNQEADVTLLRSFAPKAWNSLVVPFDISDETAKQVFGDDVKICDYKGSTRNDDGTYTLNFTSATDGIRANTPVFIYGVTTSAPFRFENAQIKAIDSNPTANDGQSGVFCFIGSYTVPSTLTAGDWFISSDNNFYRAKGKETMRGTRAVFRPTESSANLAKMNIDDTPTDIHAIRSENRADDALYNLQGQKLTTAPAHGVFIQNGQKVVR
ncbi:MAG TPA: hypothetical protein DD401_01540 [Prevotella sp.]|nr:hypothetical protein [Prevotella sp.]